jgi:diguanylate cyclase (GGDEF)-like protein
MTNGVVLLVEDSSVIRAVVRRRLEEQGYRVVEVEDGGGALSAFRECRPDVVLLDIEMPVLDGFQILELIKAEPDQADTPVVFLTARDKTEDLVEALRKGAHDYLRKPFEPSELTARVRAAVRVKSLQDELRIRNAELELMSRTDPLTSLWNRRHTEEQLQSAASLSRRHHTVFSVLMIDVDHFKRVNDSEGHTAGDAVLVEVAARIRDAVRIEDVVARWGGEEFLVVLPSTDIDGAWMLGDRIRLAIAAQPVWFTTGSIGVTVSVGCASSRTDETGDAIVSRADDALYEAKEAGRDRTVRAS